MDVVVGWFSLSAVRSPKSVLIMTDWKLYSQSAKRGRQWWLCSISEVNRIIEGQLQTFDWLMRGRKLSQIILIWITSSKKMKVPPSCIHTFGKVSLPPPPSPKKKKYSISDVRCSFFLLFSLCGYYCVIFSRSTIYPYFYFQILFKRQIS